MNRKTILRIFIDVVLVYALAAGSWWLIFPIGIVCAWYYKNFYEFPLAAIFLDISFSAPREHLYNFQYIYTIIAIILFIIISILKTKIRKEIWQKNY